MASNFDTTAWQTHIRNRLGVLAEYDCLRCWTPHGAIDVVWGDLASWVVVAQERNELIWLNMLLSNARGIR